MNYSFSKLIGFMVFNSLPHMPILGSSNPAANFDVKNMDKWGYNYLSRKLCNFNDPEAEDFIEYYGKRRKSWFSTVPKTNFSDTFILSSANAFILHG